jgi:FlaA1/EpsC-like NDP-sugar epimerase
VSAAFIGCMYYFDLYDTSILSNRREVLTRLVQVVLIGLLIVVIILALWRQLFSCLNRRSQFAERTMIFGDEPSASRLLRELESRPELGLERRGPNFGKRQSELTN